MTYRRPAGKSERRYAIRSRGGQAFPGSFKGTRDRIAPTLKAARTSDVNSNGRLDGVTVAFTEPVGAGGALDVAGARVLGSSSSGRGVVTLRLAEGALGTGARPQVLQRGVADSAGNKAAAGAVTPADGAAPIMTAAQTADLGGAAGRLDTLRVSFSEAVTGGAASGAGTPFGVTGYTISSVPAASGQTVAIKLKEAWGLGHGRAPAGGLHARTRPRRSGPRRQRGGIARALWHHRRGGSEAAVRPHARRGRQRQARPGALHLLRAGPARRGGWGRWLLRDGAERPGRPSRQWGDRGPDAVEAALPNTGMAPPAAYAPTGSNDVRDASGNSTPAATVLSAADGARPVVMGATTADAGGSNLKIDRLNVLLSEPVSAAADSAAPFSFSASGYTVANVGAASGGQVAINLVEAADPDTGSAPTVGYTGAGVKLADAAGLEPAVGESPGLTWDFVAPRLVAPKLATAIQTAGWTPSTSATAKGFRAPPPRLRSRSRRPLAQFSR